MTPHLLLIGARASGKSSVGRRVAAELDRVFIDLDDCVLARFDESTVTAVWDLHGETAWRRAEAETLFEQLEATDGAVIAAGGGTVMIDAARSALEAARASGRVIVLYLQCSASELTRRLTADAGDRPSLTGGHVAEEVERVLTARSATYEAVADGIVDGEGAAESVADAVLAAWTAADGDGRGSN